MENLLLILKIYPLLVIICRIAYYEIGFEMNFVGLNYMIYQKILLKRTISDDFWE